MLLEIDVSFLLETEASQFSASQAFGTVDLTGKAGLKMICCTFDSCQFH